METYVGHHRASVRYPTQDIAKILKGCRNYLREAHQDLVLKSGYLAPGRNPFIRRQFDLWQRRVGSSGLQASNLDKSHRAIDPLPSRGRHSLANPSHHRCLFDFIWRIQADWTAGGLLGRQRDWNERKPAQPVEHVHFGTRELDTYFGVLTMKSFLGTSQTKPAPSSSRMRRAFPKVG
jgi:hypothetical protein